MTNHDQFESYPEISSIRIREFLLNKYPSTPSIAAMFGSAIEQKLTNNVIAWEDLGIKDPKEQAELEAEVMKLIDQLSMQKNVTIPVKGIVSRSDHGK